MTNCLEPHVGSSNAIAGAKRFRRDDRRDTNSSCKRSISDEMDRFRMRTMCRKEINPMTALEEKKRHVTTEQRFKKLAKTWKSETELFSKVTKRVLHPAY